MISIKHVNEIKALVDNYKRNKLTYDEYRRARNVILDKLDRENNPFIFKQSKVKQEEGCF